MIQHRGTEDAEIHRGLCAPPWVLRLFLILALLSINGFAQTVKVSGAPDHFEIHHLATAPVIDGIVSEAEWSGAARVDRFWEFSPEDNVEPLNAYRYEPSLRQAFVKVSYAWQR